MKKVIIERMEDKKKKILERDNYLCRCCKSKANVVHHITYKDLGNETEKQLISVCEDCHETIHSDNFDSVRLDGKYNAKFNKLKICKHNKYFNDIGKSLLSSVNYNCVKCLRLEYQETKKHLKRLINIGKSLSNN